MTKGSLVTTTTSRVPLVLVHGWAGAADAWIPVENELSESLWGPVVAVALPGAPLAQSAPHSVSAAADVVIAELERIGAPSVIVGHSMGGQVTLLAQTRRPDLVLAEVVIDPAYGADDTSRDAMAQWAERIRNEGHEAVAEFFEGSLGELNAPDRARIMDAMFSTSPGVIADYLLSEYVDPDAVGLASRTAAAAAERSRPVLSIHSSPLSSQRESLLTAPPGSSSQVWIGHRHFLHLEDPTRFARVLEEWTQEIVRMPHATASTGAETSRP